MEFRDRHGRSAVEGLDLSGSKPSQIWAGSGSWRLSNGTESSKNLWKSLKINENHRKSMKINENHRKSMKINENQWKSMKIINKDKFPRADHAFMHDPLVVRSSNSGCFDNISAKRVLPSCALFKGNDTVRSTFNLQRIVEIKKLNLQELIYK